MVIKNITTKSRLMMTTNGNGILKRRRSNKRSHTQKRAHTHTPSAREEVKKKHTTINVLKTQRHEFSLLQLSLWSSSLLFMYINYMNNEDSRTEFLFSFFSIFFF